MLRVEFNNPIMKRLVRHINWPSLPVTRLIAIAAGLVGLGVYVAAACYGGAHHFPLDNSAGLMTLGLTIFVPPFAALVAALITAHDVSQPEHQLLRLTALSAPRIVKGYTMAVAWRMRVPFAILVGLSPILLIGPGILAFSSTRIVAMGLTIGLMLALVATFQLAIVWMASLLGLYVGIWAGLKWQDVRLAAATAPVIILIPTTITGCAIHFTGGICGMLVAFWMVFMVYAVHARVEKIARAMFS
jgi:hypothetical protein